MSTAKVNRLESLTAGDVDIQHDTGLVGDLIQDVDAAETRNRGVFMPGLSWLGPWVTATAYVADEVVTESSLTYKCLVNHTSGVFATDLAGGDWEQLEFAALADVTFGTLFTSSTAATINVVAADRGRVWYWTGTSAGTVNLPVAAGITPPFIVTFVNNGTATLTLDGNGSEQINGATTQILYPGQQAVVFCDGVSAWFAIISSRGGIFVTESTGYPVIDTTQLTVTTALAENTWESVGPTDSGADNIWTALDSVPTDVDWIEVKVVISGSDGSVSSIVTTALYTRDDGSSVGTNDSSVIAEASDYTDGSGNGYNRSIELVKVPVTVVLFDLYWSKTFTTATTTIRLTGYGYNSK